LNGREGVLRADPVLRPSFRPKARSFARGRSPARYAHESALAAFRDAGSSRISLVDRTSFAFMRSNRLPAAFAFDAHFVSAGFELVA
jgi:hypothetical protein